MPLCVLPSIMERTLCWSLARACFMVVRKGAHSAVLKQDGMPAAKHMFPLATFRAQLRATLQLCHTAQCGHAQSGWSRRSLLLLNGLTPITPGPSGYRLGGVSDCKRAGEVGRMTFAVGKSHRPHTANRWMAKRSPAKLTATVPPTDPLRLELSAAAPALGALGAESRPKTLISRHHSRLMMIVRAPLTLPARSAVRICTLHSPSALTLTCRSHDFWIAEPERVSASHAP